MRCPPYIPVHERSATQRKLSTSLPFPHPVFAGMMKNSLRAHYYGGALLPRLNRKKQIKNLWLIPFCFYPCPPGNILVKYVSRPWGKNGLSCSLISPEVKKKKRKKNESNPPLTAHSTPSLPHHSRRSASYPSRGIPGQGSGKTQSAKSATQDKQKLDKKTGRGKRKGGWGRDAHLQHGAGDPGGAHVPHRLLVVRRL